MTSKLAYVKTLMRMNTRKLTIMAVPFLISLVLVSIIGASGGPCPDDGGPPIFGC